MKRKISEIMMILFFASLLVSPVLSQELTGSLAGKIVDTTDEPLPGCRLTLTSPALLGEKNFVCTEGGLFRFPALPPGTYAMTALMPGFKKLTLEGLIVSVGKTTTITVKLEQSTLEEEVTVTTTAPVVDVKSSKVSVSYTRALLDNIPLERNISEVINSAPGAIAGVEGQSTVGTVGVVGGTTTAASRYALDGVDMTDPAVGGPNINLSYDLYEEVEVELGAHPADVGNVPGAYVNIVTRSGGNDIHGQAMAYYFNESFVDKNFSKEQLDTLKITSPAMDKWNRDASLVLGGPIFKDRLWFFVSGRYTDSAELVAGFPKDITHKEWFGFGKLTFQAASNIKFMGYVNFVDIYEPYSQASSTVSVEATRIWDESSWTGNGQLNWILSQNAFLDIRIMWTQRIAEFLQQPGATHLNTDRGTGMTTGSVRYNEYTKRGRFQIYPSFTLFLDDFLGGNHEVKIGGEYERSWTTNECWHPDPIMTWSWSGSPYYFGGNRGQFRALGYSPTKGEGEKPYAIWRYASYLQDKWTLMERLTLNLGLRYWWTTGGVPAQYYEEVPTWLWLDPKFFARLELPAVTDLLVLKGFDPRLGLSFDVFGNGKTVFKASYSHYYDYMMHTFVAAYRTINYVQYLWTDVNYNMAIDPGDAFTMTTKYGRPDYDPRLEYDPNTKGGAWNEYIVGIDNEMIPNFRVGVNFIYRHQPTIALRMELNSQINWATPYSVKDPGYDGVFGTSDDALLTIFDQTKPFERYITTNPPNAWRKYRALEFIFDRRMRNRWQLMGSIVYSKMWGTIGGGYGTVQGTSSNFDTPNGYINIEGPSDYDRPLVIKMQGTYQLPYGINLSASYVHSSGAPFTRRVSILAPKYGAYVTINAEPQGSRRNPSWNNMDLRVEKEFVIGDVGRLGLWIDVFNAFNGAYVFVRTGLHGRIEKDGKFTPDPLWNTVGSVSLPRVIKLGLRFSF